MCTSACRYIMDHSWVATNFADCNVTAECSPCIVSATAARNDRSLTDVMLLQVSFLYWLLHTRASKKAFKSAAAGSAAAVDGNLCTAYACSSTLLSIFPVIPIKNTCYLSTSCDTIQLRSRSKQLERSTSRCIVHSMALPVGSCCFPLPTVTDSNLTTAC